LEARIEASVSERILTSKMTQQFFFWGKRELRVLLDRHTGP